MGNIFNMYYRPAPTVTIFLFTYNQEDFVREACLSILAQDYSHLAIIISDDCSTDNTFQILSEIVKNYTGSHQITLNRNQKNLGLIPHVNLANKMVTTDLLIAAAGDDISEPNRVTKIVEVYRLSEKQPTSLYSSVRKMSPAGDLLDIWIPPLENNQKTIQQCAISSSLIIGASHAWHRSIFEKFGDITELGAFEDLVIAYRSALLDGLVYINQPLVQYRLGVGISESGKHDTVKNNILDKNKQRIRKAKIMIPVLKQRIIDTKKMNKDLDIIPMMQNKLNQYEIEFDFLNGNKDFITLLNTAIQSSTTMYFLKLWFKRLRRKI